MSDENSDELESICRHDIAHEAYLDRLIADSLASKKKTPIARKRGVCMARSDDVEQEH